MPKKRPPMPRMPAKVYLREWLIDKDMTAEQLAEKLQTSKSVISKLETGEQRWNQDWLEEIAFIFGCQVRHLFMKPEHVRVDQIANRLADEMEQTEHK